MDPTHDRDTRAAADRPLDPVQVLPRPSRRPGIAALALAWARKGAVAGLLGGALAALVSFYEQHGFSVLENGDEHSLTMRRAL
jgi:hypothetical protein